MLFLPVFMAGWLTFASWVAPTPVKKRKLVWREEFNTRGQPSAKDWVFEAGYIRNKELQYYTNRPENARVENGNLVIEARLDSFAIEGKKVPITSASLTTKGKHEWQYGRIEVRAKIPSALGTWPAIWLLGTNHQTAGWPACGEIDMMEHVGYDPDTLHFNIHTKAYNHIKHTNKGQKIG
ncbi:MAG: glycoside hydrolase family 16 protein, partial [Bacteroidota bacterium]|nr:glycoside hydrolase family 16 protein [Bacteroidota bacterium]